MTVLHASQCTPLASCSSAMDVEQDKGWIASIFEWLRRYYGKNPKICSYLNDRTCKLIALAIEIYYLLYLDRWFLGPQVTLQDCLSAFFSADELKGTSYSIMKR